MPKKLELKAVFKGVDRMSRPINRIQRRIKRFSERSVRAMRRIQKVTRKLAKGIGKVLKKSLQGATVALLAFGAAAAKVIQIGASFEKTLVTAAVKFPGKIRQGTEAYKQLEDAARKTGSTTEFTSQQSAEALESLAMAGFDLEQAIAALPGVVNLATSANLELSDASNIATKTLGAFGLKTKDATKLGENLNRVNDVMAKTVTSVATDMPNLFEAIKAGANTARDAGADIETFSALVGTMAGSGKEGESAGTALRNMFLRIQAPVGSAAKLVKKYAGDIEDADGNMVDFVEIIARMEKSMGKLGGVEKTRIIDKIFGKKAIEATKILFGEGSEKIEELRKQLKAAAGTSEEMSSTIRNTTSGSIDSLKSAVEGLIIDLFKLEDKGIKGAIDGMVKWVRENKKLIASKVGAFLKDLIKKGKEFIEWAKKVRLIEKMKDGFELLGKAIGFVVENIKPISILAGVVLGIAAAVEVLTAVTAIMNFVALANPMVLMFMAIAAVSAFTIGAIIMNWDDIKYFFEETGRFLKNIFLSLWDFVLTIFNSTIGKIVYGPIHLLIGAYKTITKGWDPAKGFFQNMWDGILETFVKAWEQIKEIGSNIKGFFKFLFTTGNKAGVDINLKSPPDLKVLPGGKAGDPPDSSATPQIVSPGDRAASSIEERNLTTTNQSEVTIKDETGRAEVTGGKLGSGVKMEPTGTFD